MRIAFSLPFRRADGSAPSAREVAAIAAAIEAAGFDGIWIAVGPMTRLDGEADEAVLGNAVLAALAVSGDGVPRPPTPRAVTENLLRFVGQRSWSTFARTARLVEARSEEEGRVRLIPFARAARGAYESVDGAATSVPAEQEAVGRGVRAAFAAAR